MKASKPYSLVYIIIRNHNAFNLTSECIDSLLKLSYPDYRILVVDDGSKDDSAKRIIDKYPLVTLIKTGKYVEYCKGLNLGIRQAIKDGAEYVFLVNNDTKDFSENYLEEVVKTFQSDEKIGLVGTLCNDYEKGVRWDGTPKNKLGVSMETPTEGFIVKSDVFNEIGLLNEMLVRYFEDLDFIIRLRNAGYTTKSVTSVSFSHLGGGTSKKQRFIPNYYRVRNIILFMKKHCRDQSFEWKIRKFRSYLNVHIGRISSSLKKFDIFSIAIITSSVFLGILAGLFMRWSDDNQI